MGKSRKKVDKTDKNHKSRFAYGEGRSGEDTKFIHGLIVICVLGLITLFVLLSIRKNQVETRDNMRKADLAKTAQTLEEYFKTHKEYLPTVELPKDPHKQLYYSYRVSEDGKSYSLFARLENSKDPEIVATDADCGARCNYQISNDQ